MERRKKRRINDKMKMPKKETERNKKREIKNGKIK